MSNVALESIQISPKDNVIVALRALTKGEVVKGVTLQEDIPKGHKFTLIPIEEGNPIIKYGFPIGIAKQAIPQGAWVHTHNVRTGLDEEVSYTYTPEICELPSREPDTFMGYMRKDGRAAVRNEIWIIPTVGCVNGIAQSLVMQTQHLVKGSVEGIYAYPHPFGCSQMGTDHEQTRKVLTALAKHPNAGGVLVLGLGCENLTLEQFKDIFGEYESDRVRFLICQEVDDEVEAGKEILASLAEYVGQFKREPIPASKLVVGMKCGGSDGLSGVTANPLVGKFSDLLIAQGGTTVLTEVPEMFGAENLLLGRCLNRDVFDSAVKMITDFKQYYIDHGQVVYENPSPGNKAGGITTLEDKSCGCVQKGGSAAIVDVLSYADCIKKQGLNLLSGPGNDLVSTTALTAAGAHIILFTTGRGTPFGAPAPTVKIATNNEIFNQKRNWLDFNAGRILSGESFDDVAESLLQFVLGIASGNKTQTEKNGYREISIFKDGVVL